MPGLADRLYDFCTVNFSKPILAKSLPGGFALTLERLCDHTPSASVSQELKVGGSGSQFMLDLRPHYSYLRETIGSTRIALRAGI